MTTYDDIARAGATIKTLPIKGKEYAQVPERVKAFRMVHPEGAIVTEIVSMDGKRVVMRATVMTADGRVLGTGTAFEDQDSSYINKTSYIENCETSAVGRALGNCGYGIDVAMCSAEELQNALEAQKAQQQPEPAAPIPETIQPGNGGNYEKVREFCLARQLTAKAFGDFRNMAVKNGVIPDKRVNELTDDEFTALLAFVEGCTGG